jgi:hypothetical protein
MMAKKSEYRRQPVAVFSKYELIRLCRKGDSRMNKIIDLFDAENFWHNAGIEPPADEITQFARSSAILMRGTLRRVGSNDLLDFRLYHSTSTDSFSSSHFMLLAKSADSW